MRIYIVLGILLLLDLYAFQSVRVVLQPASNIVKYMAYALYAAISIYSIYFMWMVINGHTDSWSKMSFTIARALVMVAYISKLFPILFLLIDDLRRLVGLGYSSLLGNGGFNPSRKRFLSQVGLAIGAIPFTSLTYGILRNPYRYKLYETEVPISGLPDALDGMKIVQISDIHSGSFFFKEPIKNAIQLINAQNADLVFFTGDMVNNQAVEMEPYMDVFSQIDCPNGVYSVRGNHDFGDYHRFESPEAKEANQQRFEEIQQEMGWQLLKNENRTITIKGEQVSVIGIENSSALSQFRSYGDLSKAAEGAGAPLKILLSHDPTYWLYKVVPEFSDIQLTLSGHTHGFQFGLEIPGFLRWSPSQYVYKQWAGLYTEGKQQLYVNRGLGFLGYPGRVGILPEVTLLKLIKA